MELINGSLIAAALLLVAQLGVLVRSRVQPPAARHLY